MNEYKRTKDNGNLAGDSKKETACISSYKKGPAKTIIIAR